MLNKIINMGLYPFEKLLVHKFTEPQLPCIFIVSLPRACSTLLHQLLVQRYYFSYVSNLQARSWKIPYIGAKIIKPHLLKKEFKSNYTSEFGNTQGDLEPHEWGWFWKQYFSPHYNCTASKIRTLRKELSALESVHEKPLLFDNCYLLPYLGLIGKEIINSIFINLKRDPFFIINSIIKARMKRYGDINVWYAEKPRNYPEIVKLNPVKQCVAQIYYLDKQLKDEVDKIPKNRVLEINCEDIWERPSLVMKHIGSFVLSNGYKLKIKDNDIPERFENRNKLSFVNSSYLEELKLYYEEYFNTD